MGSLAVSRSKCNTTEERPGDGTFAALNPTLRAATEQRLPCILNHLPTGNTAQGNPRSPLVPPLDSSWIPSSHLLPHVSHFVA